MLGSKVDIIAGIYGDMRWDSNKLSVLLPITARNPLASRAGERLGSDDDVPAQILKTPAIATFGRFFSQRDPDAPTGSISTIILDYRTAPQAITPSLRWILPLGKEPAPLASGETANPAPLAAEEAR